MENNNQNDNENKVKVNGFDGYNKPIIKSNKPFIVAAAILILGMAAILFTLFTRPTFCESSFVSDSVNSSAGYAVESVTLAFREVSAEQTEGLSDEQTALLFDPDHNGTAPFYFVTLTERTADGKTNEYVFKLFNSGSIKTLMFTESELGAKYAMKLKIKSGVFDTSVTGFEMEISDARLNAVKYTATLIKG